MFINNKQFNFDGTNQQPQEMNQNPAGNFYQNAENSQPVASGANTAGEFNQGPVGYSAPSTNCGTTNQPNSNAGYGVTGFNTDAVKQNDSYTYSTTPKGKPIKDKSPKFSLLLITLIAFVFVSMMPLYHIGEPLDVNIYATDLGRISKIGMDLPEIAEGDLIQGLKNSTLEQDESDPYAVLSNEIKSTIIESAEAVEPIFVYLLNLMKKSSIALLAASVLGFIGFAASVFAAAKNLKKLYFLANLALLAMFAIMSAAVVLYTEMGLGIIGYGMWLAMATFAVGCMASLKK